MTISLQRAWREHAATTSHRSSATFTETGLLLGADTVLVAFDTALGKTDAGPGLAPSAHDRLVGLLAVAGRGHIGEATLLQIGQAIDDWRKGEKALAAIRLAFAKLPRVHDADDAYRLFLADKALDAGLRPHELLEELGYATALRPLLKYPGQPRNPAGRPTGGQYANGRSGDPASASIVPAFLDTRHKYEPPDTLPDPMHPVPSLQPGVPELDLLPPAGAPLPLPFLAPKAKPDEENKEGPSCPPEKPDVPNGPNAAAEAWERFVHGFVNPSDPTKDGNAYYLPNPAYVPGGRQRALVSYDDCKKSDEPSRIPGIKKGDMVDGKNHAFNWLYGMSWSTSLQQLDDQLRRQEDGIQEEGRGRHLFYCYDGDFAATLARMQYGEKYHNTKFLNCR